MEIRKGILCLTSVVCLVLICLILSSKKVIENIEIKSLGVVIKISKFPERAYTLLLLTVILVVAMINLVQ